MLIDGIIAFSGVTLVGVVGFTLHWRLGRQDRIERERAESEKAKLGH